MSHYKKRILFAVISFLFYGMIYAYGNTAEFHPTVRSRSDLTNVINEGLQDRLLSHRSLDIFLLSNFILSNSVERMLECRSLRTVKIGLDLLPFDVLSARILYFISKYPEYSIEENNIQLLLTPELLAGSRDFPLLLSVSAGFNFRRIKFGKTEYNLTGQMNPLIENFVLWQILTGFKPSDEIMINLKLGNLSDYTVNNINYWELSPSMIYNIAGNLYLIVSGGFSMVGALPFAASPGRRWLAIGSEYAY